MRPRLLLGGTVVLVLLLAVALTMCSDSAPHLAGNTAPATTGGEPSDATSARGRLPRAPVDEAGSDALGRARPSAPASPDGGAPDGGSLDEFIETVGRQAVLQWLADNAAAAEKYVDRYCAETKDLVPRKDLGQPPRERDAARYMDGRSDWEGGRLGLLHLPASITDRMANPPGAWRQAGPQLYAGLDFSWMVELQQFDHWSLLAAGPLKDKQDYTFFEAPLPNYVTLQNWAKLRLLKGIHEGNLAQASVEVRHLAELCGSSGTLIGEMIRISFYGIERKTWEDVGQQPPEAVMSADDAWRTRHASFVGMYMLYPGVPRAVREKALKCIPTRCAALMEGIGAAASLSQLVPDAQKDVDWLLAQSPCDVELAKRVSRSPPVSSEMIRQNFTGDQGLERSLRSMTDGGL